MKLTFIRTVSLIALVFAPSPVAFGQSQNHVEIFVTAKDAAQRLAKAGEAELALIRPQKFKAICKK